MPRAEVDRAGYDLVLEWNGVLRPVQLKVSDREAKTAEVGIHLDRASKPSGCVLWIWFDAATLELGPFLWFGAAPGAPLPPLGARLARHSKGDATGRKAEWPNIPLLRKRQFEVLADIDAVIERLFEA